MRNDIRDIRKAIMNKNKNKRRPKRENRKRKRGRKST